MGGVIVLNPGTTGTSNDNNAYINGLKADDETWITEIPGALPNSHIGGDGPLDPVITYSPVYNCAVFGGGSATPYKLRRLNSDGSFSNLVTTLPNNLSVGTGITGAGNGRLWTEPVTGKCLILANPYNDNSSPFELHELNPSTGALTQLTGTNTPPMSPNSSSGGATGLMVSPAPAWGVTFVIQKLTTADPGGQMWMYKHPEA